MLTHNIAVSAYKHESICIENVIKCTHTKFTFGWTTIENSGKHKKKSKRRSKNCKRKVERKKNIKCRRYFTAEIAEWESMCLESLSRSEINPYTHKHTLKTLHFELFLIFVKLLLLQQSTSSIKSHRVRTVLSAFFLYSSTLFPSELHLHKHPIVFYKKREKRRKRAHTQMVYNVMLLLISMMLMFVVDRWKSVKMHEKSIINYDCAWLCRRRHQQQQQQQKRREALWKWTKCNDYVVSTYKKIVIIVEKEEDEC